MTNTSIYFSQLEETISFIFFTQVDSEIISTDQFVSSSDSTLYITWKSPNNANSALINAENSFLQQQSQRWTAVFQRWTVPIFSETAQNRADFPWWFKMTFLSCIFNFFPKFKSTLISRHRISIYSHIS